MRVESVSFNGDESFNSPSPSKSNQSQTLVSPFRFKDKEQDNTEYVRMPSRTSSNASFTPNNNNNNNSSFNNKDTNFYYANVDYTNKGIFFHSIPMNQKKNKNKDKSRNIFK